MQRPGKGVSPCLVPREETYTQAFVETVYSCERINQCVLRSQSNIMDIGQREA
jgi:hypothetical protein